MALLQPIIVLQFAALITIILICELGAGIAGYVLRGKVETWLTDGMKDSMNNYDEKDGVTATWDKVQQEVVITGAIVANGLFTMISTKVLAYPGMKCSSIIE